MHEQTVFPPLLIKEKNVSRNNPQQVDTRACWGHSHLFIARFVLALLEVGHPEERRARVLSVDDVNINTEIKPWKSILQVNHLWEMLKHLHALYIIWMKKIMLFRFDVNAAYKQQQQQ